ncbi:MAG: hypothetical protein Q8S26_05055 [Azonexus sp.]|nr:hypothetical protein [Azonexus sp.]
METLLVGLLKVPVLGRWLEALCAWQYRILAASMRRARRYSVRPREWSNCELAKVASAFDGAVINVSGWRDEDQRGGHYRDYFTRAASYSVSNFRGTRGMEDETGKGVFIDLEAGLPESLRQQYQVAFNHTTLEHVFLIEKAIENICALSSDTVILVTPFLQSVHFEEGAFGDYWRPTPMCINRILESQGFTTIYQSANDTPWHYVYVFTVASRDPRRNIGLSDPLKIPVVGSGHFSV